MDCIYSQSCLSRLGVVWMRTSTEILRTSPTFTLNLVSLRCPLPPTCSYNASLPGLWHQSQPHGATAQRRQTLRHSSRGIAKPPVSSGIYHTSACNFPKIDLLALWGSRSSDGSLLSRGPMACHWTMAPAPAFPLLPHGLAQLRQAMTSHRPRLLPGLEWLSGLDNILLLPE